MNTKIIKLRVDLNKVNLRNYINNFFRDTEIKFQYIYINIKVSIEGGKSSYDLGSKTLIDLSNKGEVKKYKISIMNNFLKNETKSIANDTITIYYKESDKESDDFFIKEIYNYYELKTQKNYLPKSIILYYFVGKELKSLIVWLRI